MVKSTVVRFSIQEKYVPLVLVIELALFGI